MLKQLLLLIASVLLSTSIQAGELRAIDSAESLTEDLTDSSIIKKPPTWVPDTFDFIPDTITHHIVRIGTIREHVIDSCDTQWVHTTDSFLVRGDSVHRIGYTKTYKIMCYAAYIHSQIDTTWAPPIDVKLTLPQWKRLMRLLSHDVKYRQGGLNAKGWESWKLDTDTTTEMAPVRKEQDDG